MVHFHLGAQCWALGGLNNESYKTI